LAKILELSEKRIGINLKKVENLWNLKKKPTVQFCCLFQMKF